MKGKAIFAAVVLTVGSLFAQPLNSADDGGFYVIPVVKDQAYFDMRYVNVSGDSMSGSSSGAILSIANSGTGMGFDVSSSGNIGVRGLATATGSGVSYGGYFEAYKESGVGVAGATNGASAKGVSGTALGANGVGVHAYSKYGRGLDALTSSSSTNAWVSAVYGRNEGQGDGVFGWSQNRHGVFGVTYSPDATDAGVHGENQGGGVAGWFSAANDHLDLMLGGAVGRINTDSAYPDSNLILSSNNDVDIRLDNNGGGNGRLNIKNSGGQSVFNVDEAGTATTRVLTITGGSDLSELFNVRAAPSAPVPSAGMVVSIDAVKPGELVISRTAYDRKIAGVISGAGGVKTGMLMGQQGSEADGATPVALSGRVYCWADASTQPIEPGDLLTTSDLAGHAMKVTDHARAQGAVLGKAMSSLESGKGLVLVLVSLQ